jgi:hypothetical protein
MVTNVRRPTTLILMAAAATLALTGLSLSLNSQEYPKGNIPTYDVVLTVRPDGVLRVRETFTFDFAARETRGLLRRIPYRHGDRLQPIENLKVSSTTHAPVNVQNQAFAHQRLIRIGDGKPVSGRQAYVMTYDVRGAVMPRPTGEELVWDALGSGWGVHIDEAAVRVEGPSRFASGCVAGRGDEVSKCGRLRRGPYAVDFTQTGLRPGEGMVVRAAFPASAVHSTPPRYARPHLDFSAPAIGTVLAAGILAALPIVFRRTSRIPRAWPGPRPWLSRVLFAAGTALILWDMTSEVATGGLWRLSVGDGLLYGLALLLLAGVPAPAAQERVQA